MSLNKELVKKLRAKTDAGIKDCNNALKESKNNLEKALEWLRLKGVTSAKKKSHRMTKEGVITIFNANNQAVLLELNAETDFVCKSKKFLKLASKLAETAHQHNAESVSDLLNYSIDGIKINEYISEHIAIIGENIILKRIKLIKSENGQLYSYIHGKNSDDSGSIVTIVDISGNNLPEVQKLAQQLSMHITATKPIALNISDLDRKVIEKEKQILSIQVEQEGKPQNIAKKIVEGKMNKFYENVVLMEQTFVMDSKIKIKNLDRDMKNRYGNTISGFTRFEVGENLDD